MTNGPRRSPSRPPLADQYETALPRHDRISMLTTFSPTVNAVLTIGSRELPCRKPPMRSIPHQRHASKWIVEAPAMDYGSK